MGRPARILGGTLPRDSAEAFLQAILERTWQQGTVKAGREVLRVLATGRPLDRAALDLIFEDIRNRAIRTAERIARHRFARVVTGEPNLQPLASLLRERERILRQQLTSYRFTLETDAINLLNLRQSEEWTNFLESIDIGRRGQDVIREVSLRTLEKAFLKGQPTALTRVMLRKEFRDRQINILAPNARPQIRLEIFPYVGEFRNYEIDAYAELVALTTTAEATQVGFDEQAAEIGTRLIKYNFIRKDYLRLGDPVCHKLNGNIFSLDRDGTDGKSGKHYRWIGEVLTRGFKTAHPRCDHIGRPIPEEFA